MIKIEKMIPGGQALGTNAEGKKIFFWNALPSEDITDFKTTKIKSNFNEAVALEIINESKYRANPKDEHFLSTSPWQIIDYNYELKIKQSLIVEIFREHGINLETGVCPLFR